MALKHWRSSTLPLALLGALALGGAALAAPEGTKSDGKPTAASKKDAKAKPDAKSKTKSKPEATAKSDEKSRAKAQSDRKADPKSKAGAKANAKADAKAKAKAAAPAATAKPDGPNGHIPASEAALRPTVSGDGDSVAKDTPTKDAPAKSAKGIPAPAATIITTPALDQAALKRALELVRSRKQSDAAEVKNRISDPLAKKLIEWVILRSDDAGADYARFAAFIAANPNWPSIVTLRRRAEAMLWQEKPDPATVRGYFTKWPPLSAKGKFALARALLAQNDRKGGEALIRDAWRHDGFSQDVEAKTLEAFGEMLTRADHKARMDRRLYEKDDTEAGMRMANRLGGHEPLIAKARIAMLEKGGSKAAVEAVPAAARDDIGYKFARIQMLRRADNIVEAAALMRSVPNPLDSSHDLDEWWVERRYLARKLLDEGDAKTAYAVARDATPPPRDNYRAEHQFTAGWIAFRFLKDASTAYAHFKKIGEGTDSPITLGRAGYWQGRAAEALNKPKEARAHYQEGARYPTSYYGQLARAKIGHGDLNLNPFPSPVQDKRAKLAQSDVVRAVELLYAVDARDLAWTMMADLGDKLDDAELLALLSEVAAKYNDARGMLLVGKLSLGRGHPLDHAAFPTIGVPDYKPIGPEVEPAIVYSIVRQESWFNPKTRSSANALGLMQVTPAAGRYVANKFKVAFDQNKLFNDTTYNVQMGAAELGDLIKDYRTSYILSFAAYNAGRGRVKDWIERFGDPRDPKVDPVDWVERIPFAETRNYVQRVMENVQVYRVRFGGQSKLLIEADLRRGVATN